MRDSDLRALIRSEDGLDLGLAERLYRTGELEEIDYLELLYSRGQLGLMGDSVWAVGSHRVRAGSKKHLWRPTSAIRTGDRDQPGGLTFCSVDHPSRALAKRFPWSWANYWNNPNGSSTYRRCERCEKGAMNHNRPRVTTLVLRLAELQHHRERIRLMKERKWL